MSEALTKPESAKVVEIGSCGGCGRRGRVSKETCAVCAKMHHPCFGAIVNRIKRDPRFKKVCYEALKTDPARAEFVRRYGTIE